MYILFVLGINNDTNAAALQLGGILISTLSLVKGVAEAQITNNFQNGGDFLNILKSIPFVLPHTLLRAFCFPIIAAFLKHYAFIAFSLLLTINFIIAMTVIRVPYTSLKIGNAFRYM